MLSRLRPLSTMIGGKDSTSEYPCNDDEMKACDESAKLVPAAMMIHRISAMKQVDETFIAKLGNDPDMIRPTIDQFIELNSLII